jgi:REP element-mobilizing transposase RayT
MCLNDAGRAAELFWKAIPEHFPRAQLDAHIVMPNHIHGIIWIVDASVGANNHLPLQLTRSKLFPAGHGTSKTIGSIVRGFKIAVTRWMRLHGRVTPVWQRNYHDHIIRNERSLNRIRKYIRENPANWHRDRNNPQRRV